MARRRSPHPEHRTVSIAPDPPATTAAVHQALATLGADLNAARRRRRLPLAYVAARAGTTRQTISRIERGDPHVAIGTWAAVLHALGLADRLTALAALAVPTNDLHTRFLEGQLLPQRVRSPSLGHQLAKPR